MPAKKNMPPELPRKSSRQHVRDTSPKAKKSRKMAGKSAEQVGSSGVVVQKRPRGRPPLHPRPQPVATVAPMQKKKSTNRKVDSYCWLCHREWPANETIDRKCNTCPRVYHHQCLGPAHRFTQDGLHCPECRLQTTDGTPLKNILPINELAKLLRLVLKTLVDLVPDFKTWRHTGCESERCVRMMELAMLEDRLKLHPSTYSTTAKFFADIKWIVHNCHIVYGVNSALTNKAKLLVKHCKEELNDLEACPECFLKSHVPEDTFTEVCDPPHTLVWAKMKGFPYWPAKVLKVIDGVANIRFFGSHEKAKVPVANCLMLSHNSPNTKQVRNKKSFDQALDECYQYVENYEVAVGPFPYYTEPIAFNPGSSNYVTKNSHAMSKTTEPRPRYGRPGRPRKARPVESSDYTEASVASPDVSADSTEIESESDSDIEIIGPSASDKCNFLNNLELSGRSDARPLQWQNIQQTIPDNQNLQMDFVVEPNCTYPYLKLPSNPVTEAHNQIIPFEERVVSDMFQDMISAVESETSRNLDPTEMDLVMAYRALAVPNNPPLVNQNPPLVAESVQGSCDYSSVFALSNNVVAPHNAYNVSVSLDKHVTKIMSVVQASMQEMYSEVIGIPPEHYLAEKRHLQQKIEELEKTKANLERKAEIMKHNTDSVIRKMKRTVEKETQKAVEKAKLLWEKEQRELNELRESQMREQFEQETQKKLEILRSRWEEEKSDAVEEAKTVIEKQLAEHYMRTREQWEIETQKEISEIKKSQWSLRGHIRGTAPCVMRPTTYDSARYSPLFHRGKAPTVSRMSNTLQEFPTQNVQPYSQNTSQLSPSAPQLFPNLPEPVPDALSQSANAPPLSPSAPELSPSATLPSSNTPSD